MDEYRRRRDPANQPEEDEAPALPSWLKRRLIVAAAAAGFFVVCFLFISHFTALVFAVAFVLGARLGRPFPRPKRDKRSP